MLCSAPSLFAMETVDRGPVRLNVGLRMENTDLNFSGNAATTPADATGKATGPQVVRRVTGTQNYTDLFPSAQLRIAADENSNIRFAVTRGIASDGSVFLWWLRNNGRFLAPAGAAETVGAKVVV